MRRIGILLAVLFLAGGRPMAVAETTRFGKITGQVFDAATREPLIGANIQVVGTTLGAVSRPDGAFVIDRVPEGTWALRVTMVGYKAIIEADLVVNAVKP
ncbi:carboxypeptidase-like regulatory domain-containing protein, partial [bacterium]|nr:carboxypeptidase-like regulatory domain-containing protein [bacterium]